MSDSETRKCLTGDGIDTFARTHKIMKFKPSWKLRINEWNFCLLLFLFSLTIVIGKLYVNYGNLASQKYTLSSSPEITAKIINASSGLHLKDFTGFFDVKNFYEKSVEDVALTFSKKYGSFLRALITGLLTIAFSWFIIYKDSNVPGVNPPFPIQTTTSRGRYPAGLNVQLNYFVGTLNGILIFLYMVL